ncbi:MAG: monofunctional biosynthetic peptidoglycan transglycosylase [Pseudomonadota bacterium]
MRTARRWLVRALLVFVAGSLLLVLLFRWAAPPGSSVMLQRWLSEGQPQAYSWKPLGSISAETALAVVAAEDQKFPNHRGFDFDAIKDAVEAHSSGGRLRGASTLTQQVARNLFLWQGRSYLRKGLEAWFTLLLETLWSKQRILEVYLNIAETGPRTFGMEAASQRYFGKPAAMLSREQAARIAAVLPNPRKYRVQQPSQHIRTRTNWILRQMRQLGGTGYIAHLLNE